VRDLLARQQGEQEALARLAAIVASSSDAILSKTLDGIITSWNAAAERMFGYTAQEIIGQPILRIIPPALHHEEKEILRRIRNGEPIKHYETVRMTKDGRALDVSLTISPVRDGAGRIIGASKIIRDETEQKRMERGLQEAHELLASRARHLENLVEQRTAKLNEAVQELEAFSYSIAHDMRAPLRAMQGFSQILIDERGGQLDDEGKSYLERISSAAHRLDQLIQDVLDYTRVVRSDIPLSAVNAEILLREIIETYPNLQGAEFEIAKPLPIVQANRAALTQVFSNLLGNAVKFVKPGVKPRVSVRSGPVPQDRSMVRYWFEDNGIGLETKANLRIFQMFQRLNRPELYEGTGIGLAIVRKAVERMGGKVGVESELGKGSRFWVDLKASKL
jgi:PAS domain S-box-containing protein